MRLLALALFMCALAIACRDGGSAPSADTLSLEGDALRDFLAGVLLTREDIPNLNQDQPDEDEAWIPPGTPGSSVYNDVSLADKGWLGTYARPFFVRASNDRVFTLSQFVMAFGRSGGAQTVLDELKASGLDNIRRTFARDPAGATPEARELDLIGGEDSWSLLVVGTTTLGGRTEELVSAQVVFRRGPVLAVIGVVGYVQLDEALLQDLADKLDGRMRDALEKL